MYIYRTANFVLKITNTEILSKKRLNSHLSRKHTAKSENIAVYTGVLAVKMQHIYIDAFGIASMTLAEDVKLL